MAAKFCPQCGNAVETEQKFCVSCGAPVEVTNTVPDETGPTVGRLGQPSVLQAGNQPQPTDPRQPGPSPAVYPQGGTADLPVRKKPGCLKIGLIALGCLIALIVIGYVVASVVLGDVAGKNYYTLGQDKVTSVKHVVGKRDLAKTEIATSNGVKTMTFVYNKMNDPQQDLTDYLQYLQEQDGFSVTKSYNLNTIPGIAQLAKPSVDSGQVILLDVSYDKDGYTLVFTKGKGTFTPGPDANSSTPAGSEISSDQNGASASDASSGNDSSPVADNSAGAPVSQVLWLNETKLDPDSKYHLGMTTGQVTEQLQKDGIKVIPSGTGNGIIEADPFYFYLDDAGNVNYIQLDLANNTLPLTTAKNLSTKDTKEDIIQKFGQPMREPYAQDYTLMMPYQMDGQYVQFDLDMSSDNVHLEAVDITSDPSKCIALE